MHPLAGYKFENNLTRKEWAAVPMPQPPVRQGLSILLSVPLETPSSHLLPTTASSVVCSGACFLTLYLLSKIVFPSLITFPSTNFSSLFQIDIFLISNIMLLQCFFFCFCCFFLQNVCHHCIFDYLSP